MAAKKKAAVDKAAEDGVPVNLTQKPDRFKDGVPVAVQSGHEAAPEEEK